MGRDEVRIEPKCKRAVSAKGVSNGVLPIAMTTPAGPDTFYSAIPVFRGFASLMDPALYSPLPDDWSIGIAESCNRPRRSRTQRYKAVNMAGAVGHRRGHQCAGGPRVSIRVRRRWRELCGVARRSRARPRGDGGDRDLGRGEPQSRDAGGAGAGVGGARAGPRRPRRPLRAVGRMSYAMFSGGGLGWAEAAMKRGEFAVPPAAPGTQPDLVGIVVPVRGNSLRARPHSVGAGGARARCRCRRISKVDRGHHRAGRAQPRCRAAGAAGRPAADMAAERASSTKSRATRGGSLLRRRAFVLANTLFIYVILRFGITRRRLRAEDLCAAGGGEFRLPQIRRRLAHDPRLHAGAGSRDDESRLPRRLRPASCATACTARTPR